MSDEMINDVVGYHVENRVAWLTIQREEARNALSTAVREGLWAGARRFNDDDSALVLVLTGSGDKAFCAGGDLKEMADTALEIPPPDFLPFFGRNIDIEKPTIAAVNGIAYAGGFLLAQMCDITIAADHAKFAVTEAKVGRGSPWAAPLSWLIPPKIALQILLTGDPISAARAREIGLVNEVVALADLRATAQAMAESIAANAPLTVRAAKKMVYANAPENLTGPFEYGDEIWAPVYTSNDGREGPLAFREKRAPNWTAT
jgi:enoyl-CoA hydratase/carnithine racemase